MAVETWIGHTVIGAVIFIAWLGSTVFLYVHGTSPWRKRPAGIAVMVMAVAMWLVLSMAMLRATFGITVPDYLRGPAYLLIAVGIWWKAITAARYRYLDLHNTKEI